MGRRERNAAGLKSGDTVAHSVPVLTRPTSPQLPVENRRLSPARNAFACLPCAFASLDCVQPKNGRGVGQSPTMFNAPVQLAEGDVSALTALSLLLDAWDRASETDEASCRRSLIACNCSTPYAEEAHDGR